jgi:hypothetical protein
MSSRAPNPGPPAAGGRHQRPPGTTDQEVAAAGKVTEALERVERARGALYDFHQLIGGADAKLGEAAEQIAGTGHAELAAWLDREMVGRNVLHGRWTFQLLEEFEELYYRPFQAAEERVRGELVAGRRHVYEAEMKEARRTHGHPGHEAEPPPRERS